MRNALMKWRKEYEKESKEHPSFTPRQIRQIVKDHRKLSGSVMSWFLAIAALGVVGVLWMTFSQVLYGTNGLANIAGVGVTDPNVTQTLNLFSTIWAAWPIVLIIGLIFLTLTAGQRQDPNYLPA